MRINFYAQNDHIVVIDGVAITGFGDGDWLEIDVDGGHVVRTPAADGPMLNSVAHQGGVISISVLPTSNALGRLYSLIQDFRFTPRLFSVVVMTGVHEIIKAGGCGFGKLPPFQSGGSTMLPRQFKMECMEIVLDETDVTTPMATAFGGLIPNI